MDEESSRQLNDRSRLRGLVQPTRAELPLLDPQATYQKKSGRWERPLKEELGGLGTHVFVGIGARLVPLSGTRSSIGR